MTRSMLAFCLGLTFLATIALQSQADTIAPSGSTTGLVPLNDLKTGLYLGTYRGGLYPNGSNNMPPAHVLAGLDRASRIQPLDIEGLPSPAGKYVLLSVGMSNTSQEFAGSEVSFTRQAAANPVVNHTTLAIVNGAKGGQTANLWASPTAANYDRVRDEQLTPRGLTEKQVQAVWLKEADAGPTMSLPSANADALQLERHLGNIVRACKSRYPNLQIVFLSSRIYAGYATTTLNPEPYAYESGFSVKWLIQAQIQQMATGHVDPIAGDLNYYTGAAPWIAWGPYLWADGLNPRSDGLIWQQQDFAADGTHPSASGQQKVGRMLLDSLLASPFSRTWFRGVYVPGDIDGDSHVDVYDLLVFVDSFGRTLGQFGYDPACDLNGDNTVDVVDLLTLVENFGQ
jgi:hypothetical protein